MRNFKVYVSAVRKTAEGMEEQATFTEYVEAKTRTEAIRLLRIKLSAEGYESIEKMDVVF